MLGFYIQKIVNAISAMANATTPGDLATLLEYQAGNFVVADMFMTMMPQQQLYRMRDHSQIAQIIDTFAGTTGSIGNIKYDKDEVAFIIWYAYSGDEAVRRWEIQQAGSVTGLPLYDNISKTLLNQAAHPSNVDEEANSLGALALAQAVLTMFSRLPQLIEALPAPRETAANWETRRITIQKLGLAMAALANVERHARFIYWSQLIRSKINKYSYEVRGIVGQMDAISDPERLRTFDLFGVEGIMGAVNEDTSQEHLGATLPTIMWPERAFRRLVDGYAEIQAFDTPDEDNRVTWQENDWGFTVKTPELDVVALNVPQIGGQRFMNFVPELWEQAIIALQKHAKMRMEEEETQIRVSWQKYFSETNKDEVTDQLRSILAMNNLHEEPVVSSNADLIPEVATLTTREIATRSIADMFRGASVPENVTIDSDTNFSYLNIGEICKEQITQVRRTLATTGGAPAEGDLKNLAQPWTGPLPIFVPLTFHDSIEDQVELDRMGDFPYMIPDCLLHAFNDAPGRYQSSHEGMAHAYDLQPRHFKMFFGTRLGASSTPSARVAVAQQMVSIGLIVTRDGHGTTYKELVALLEKGLRAPKNKNDIKAAAAHMILPLCQFAYGCNIRADMLNFVGARKPARAFKDPDDPNGGRINLVPLDQDNPEEAAFYLLTWNYVPCPPRLDGSVLLFAQDYLSHRVNQVIVPRQDAANVEYWMEMKGINRSPFPFPHARLVWLPAFSWRMSGAVVRLFDMTETRVTPTFLEAANLVFVADSKPFEGTPVQTIPHTDVTKLGVPENATPVMLYNVTDTWRI
jgi:hypothetical protein